jgi:hypothetical protein
VKKAAEILARLLDKGPASALPFPSLFGGWQEIAGPSLAEHCRAYEVRHRCLLVEADHPGWMQLLLMQKKAILAKLRERFPQLGLRDIRVRVGAAGSGQARAPRPAAAAPRAGSITEQRQAPEPPASGHESSTPAEEPAAEKPNPEPAAPPSAAIQKALAAVGDLQLREKLRLLLQELERRIDTSDDI